MNRCVLCAQILRSMAAMVWGNGENLAAWEIDHLSIWILLFSIYLKPLNVFVKPICDMICLNVPYMYI